LCIIPNSIIHISIMKNSPFIYGTTVSQKSFVDRKNEIKKLTDNLLGGVNTMLISPRRWGKSSLVERVTDTIKAKSPKIRIAMIDMFTINSEEEFIEKFANEILKASSSKWQEWIKSAKKLFKNVIPKIHISVDPVHDFSVSFDWGELKKYGDEILNLPEIIARQKKIEIIICIDEFQNIANFPDFENFEKRLRAIWQRQKSVTYCIYGSKRHMMTDIFNNSSKPFYRFGDIMMLSKIDRLEWVNYICKSFSDTGKKIGPEEAGIIADLMQCHSWYVQQLAHYTWNKTQNQATKNEIIQAFTELISANMPLYQKEAEILSTTQINLLKAVALKEKHLTSTRVMQEYRLGTPRNVSKNKTILINNDIIQDSETGLSFLDPAFEFWFRQSYLDQSFNSSIR
jgi:uncharacterized protein